MLSRTPRIRDLTDASTTQMSLLLLGISVGAVSGMVLAGRLLRGTPPRRVIAVFGSLIGAGLALAAVGAALESMPVIAGGLAIFGLGSGTTDVAMNLSGTALERSRNRALLPFLHAMFSLGTLIGAGLGALAERLDLAVSWHLVGVAVVVSAVYAAAPFYLSDGSAGAEPPSDGSATPIASAWRERTTLLIGLVVLGMALAEGAANDWLSLTMVDGHGTSNTIGAVTLGLFLGAMTATRLAGGWLIARLGRVTVVRGSALVAAAGLLLVIIPDSAAVAMAGAVVWGCGAALGFPIGLSAAGDDPARAAQRVSVAATVGYLAFLAGPPLIGFLAERAGLRMALYVVLVAVLISALASPATSRPDKDART